MADDYFSQMDSYLAPREENRFLNGSTKGSDGAARIADPIVPISKLGTTFAEKGANGQSTVLQSMLSSIRQGSGQLQLALQTSTDAAMGGGVSSIGKDQREAIKELIKASEIDFQGLEMPTSNMSNLSGFDPQRGGFSEQKRQKDLRSIKDAILFLGDIGAGGGVDIWSQEYMRNIGDTKFGKEFQDFEGYDENIHAVKTLVDDRTGQVMQFQTSSLGGQNTPEINIPIWKTAKGNGVGSDGVPYSAGDYLSAEGNKLVADSNDPNFVMGRVPEWDSENNQFKTKSMKWDEFKNYAQQRNQEEGKDLAPEVWFQRMQMETQYAQQRGQSIHYSQQYGNQIKDLNELQESLQTYTELEKDRSDEELIKMNLLQQIPRGGGLLNPEYKKRSEIIKDQINQLKQSLHHVHEASAIADAQANNVWGNITHIKSQEEYAQGKTFDTYAEAGLFAMEETKRKDVKRAIHVGPELGWPQAYGGHTDEFIEIVNNSRKAMVEKMKTDTKYRSMYTDTQMKDLAKKHISGMLDTSHLSMWYNHFPKDNDHESEEARLKRFNGWYIKQMDKLGEANVVGSVQIVDSATGDHRHLPVGQGIFPTVEAVKQLQKHGFDGAVLSEGHEEENQEAGRIQYSLWNEFGASVGEGGSGYHFGGGSGGNSFGNIYGGVGGAAGYRAPPNYIVGAYSPSNEWKLWSDVPLE